MSQTALRLIQTIELTFSIKIYKQIISAVHTDFIVFTVYQNRLILILILGDKLDS